MQLEISNTAMNLAKPTTTVVRLFALVFGALLLLACETDPVKQEIGAQQVEAQKIIKGFLPERGKKLCPLADNVVWLKPFSQVQIATDDESDGTRRYVATVQYWCRGKERSGHTSPLEGTAKVTAEATVGSKAVVLSRWEQVGTGEISSFGALFAFLIPPFIVALAFIFVSATDAWLWLASEELAWLFLLRWLIMIPAIAVPLLLLSGLVGTGWWAYAVYRSPIAVILSPLLSLPLTNISIRTYLKHIA